MLIYTVIWLILYDTAR